LQDVQRAVGNSRGARKLARTPHVNQKKKKRPHIHRHIVHHNLITKYCGKYNDL
jgi:hypothetical protein